MNSIEKIAKIFRTDKDIIYELEKKASALTGKKNVIDKIVEENQSLINDRLKLKGFEKKLSAEEVYAALIDKIKQDDLQLFKALGKPSFMLQEDVDAVLKKVSELVPEDFRSGFFLKKEKAIELLKKEPPQKVISYLGYRSAEELIEREDVFEIFAAIRLFEDQRWFNDIFAKQYLALTPNDFEEREIILKSLSQKWVGIAQNFLKKKYQNVSHLKELGMEFVVRLELGMLGETTRMFSLVLHYFYEIKFYSELFQYFKNDPKTFASNTITALKVESIDKRLPETDKIIFLIHPSYLAKHDENDWRLFAPHISPEVIFWIEAEKAMRGLNNILGDKNIHVDFSFWQNLDWVGDYFKTSTGVEILVSFNFVDNSMSLIQEKEMIKYLYHHEESLWNKIFIEYFGEDRMKELLKENMVKGWFEI